MDNSTMIPESEIDYNYYCFFESKQTNCWTRCIVERIYHHIKQVTVRCVDYGHLVRISIEELRKLPSQITLELLPCATIEVQVRNFAINNRFQEYSNEKIKKTFKVRYVSCMYLFCACFFVFVQYYVLYIFRFIDFPKFCIVRGINGRFT